MNSAAGYATLLGERIYDCNFKIKRCIIFSVNSASRIDEPNLVLWPATRAVTMKPSCPLGITCCLPQENGRRVLSWSITSHHINFVPRAFPMKVSGAPRSSHLQGKSPGSEVEGTWHISSHPGGTDLVNKPYFMHFPTYFDRKRYF